jgi:hypothetical protein
MHMTLLLAPADLTVLRALRAHQPASNFVLRRSLRSGHPELLNPGAVIQRLEDIGLVARQDRPVRRYALTEDGERALGHG